MMKPLKRIILLLLLFNVLFISIASSTFQTMDKIEILYFDGCPSSPKVIKRIKELTVDEKWEVELVLIKVETEEKAKELGFFGSPSIRINGIDIEEKVSKPSMGCRIYILDDQLTGSPPKEFLKEKINKLLNKKER